MTLLAANSGSAPIFPVIPRPLVAAVIVIAAAVAALVCYLIVSQVRQWLRDRDAQRQRREWGEKEYAQARTQLLDALHVMAGGQLQDVRQRDLVKRSVLDAHFNCVVTLAARAGFIEQHLYSSSLWAQAMAVLFRDPRMSTEMFVRFTEPGLQTFKAAKRNGQLIGSVLGSAVAVTIEGAVNEMTVIEYNAAR